MSLFQSLSSLLSRLVDRIAGTEPLDLPSDASIFYSRHSSAPRKR